MSFNSTASATIAFVGVLLSAASVACSADKAGTGGPDGGGGAGGGTTEGGVVSSGGKGGATSASGGQTNKGGGGASAGGGGAEKLDGSLDGNAGPDGNAGSNGNAGTDGGSARSGGQITITQVIAPDDYSISAGFAALSNVMVQGNSGETCTGTTSGSCIASVCTFPNVDAGSPKLPASASLNAGTIQVTGPGTSKATLKYGVIAMTTVSGYAPVNEAAQFFKGGEELSVSGAGGPDLPAFAIQSLTAPSKAVLTAPACTAAGCDDVDRTKDMTVTWTGGGAGTLTVTLETIAEDSVAIVTCDFDAKGGKGTVPKAVLALLGKAGDGTTTGVESFIAGNSTKFAVGSLPTTFKANMVVKQTTLTVSK